LPWQEEEHQRKPCQEEESQVCPGRKRNTKGNPIRKRRVKFALAGRGTRKETLPGRGESSWPWQEEEHQIKPCQEEESQVCLGWKRNTKGNPVRKRRLQFALAGRETLVKYWQEGEHTRGEPLQEEEHQGKPCRRGSTKETLVRKGALKKCRD
jgi:hypothetical protein